MFWWVLTHWRHTVYVYVFVFNLHSNITWNKRLIQNKIRLKPVHQKMENIFGHLNFDPCSILSLDGDYSYSGGAQGAGLKYLFLLCLTAIICQSQKSSQWPSKWSDGETPSWTDLLRAAGHWHILSPPPPLPLLLHLPLQAVEQLKGWSLHLERYQVAPLNVLLWWPRVQPEWTETNWNKAVVMMPGAAAVFSGPAWTKAACSLTSLLSE